MGELAAMKSVPVKRGQKSSRLDTIIVTPELVQTWKRPPFQRPVKENQKVIDASEEMKQNGGVWSGVVSLGILGRDTYLIDGQHRRHAFILSGLKEGITDVRIHTFNDMAEMGEEFVRLNSQMVRLNPDDILRGLEESIDAVRILREKCPFVGYDSVRRGGMMPMVSMSVVLRCWSGSSSEVPQNNASAATAAAMLDDESVTNLAAFLDMSLTAFGRDPEYYRLWGALNLSLCMWLYRRIVLGWQASTQSRVVRLKPDEFKRCLMALSANRDYVDWLVGRNTGERDRSPCYDRIKKIMAKRVEQERGVKVSFPQPSWSHTRSGK
jgi:hypothetical protein